MAGWMEKARGEDVIPFCIGGDFQEFWEMRIGWLARMYQDGFYCTPEKWDLSRCQEGDWCFEKGVDDQFPAENWAEDPHFDDADKVNQNYVRWLNSFQEGKLGPKDPEYRALMEQFKLVFKPENLPPGWTGVNGQTAYSLFLSGKCLFWLDGGWTIANIEKDLNNLRTGKFFAAGEGTPTPTPDPSYEGIEPFEFGTFDNPRMDVPEATCPWQRTIEWPVGFWSVPVKEAAQNDLEIDFMQYVTSPEGWGIYLENKLDPENPGGSLTGPTIVKGAALPPEVAAKFENLKPIGNTEKATAGSGFSRGVGDYQPMVREWVNLAQQYFTDQIDLDTYIEQYDEMLRRDDLWQGLLEKSQLTEEDMQNPEKKPVAQQ
jgi:ABC-type glycerol-3-phosphate transport system substrate-binding protein